MRSYLLVDKALSCIYAGGRNECLSLAADYCRMHPSEELCLLQFRGGEPQGLCVYRVDCSGYKQEFPLKFVHKAQISKLKKPVDTEHD